LLLVPAPDFEARKEIFKIHTKNMPLDKAISLNDLSHETEGFTGADIEGLCREAAMLSLRNNIKSKIVKMEDFAKAMYSIRPSITESVINYYKEISKDLGSGVAKKDKSEKDIQYT
jgi:transitional endoplasmic reticulum ATPase